MSEECAQGQSTHMQQAREWRLNMTCAHDELQSNGVA